jgi:serine/threonine-protein kinase CHEK1
MSSSQPTTMERQELSESEYSQLSEEPSMSQFTANPHLPESLVKIPCLILRLTIQTQRASRFKDLCPPERLTQFHSLLARHELLDTLVGALRVQNVITPLLDIQDDAGNIRLPIHHIDKRKCPLQGEIRIMRYSRQGVWVVKFIKSRGDPLEFRRFFKVCPKFFSLTRL